MRAEIELNREAFSAWRLVRSMLIEKRVAPAARRNICRVERRFRDRRVALGLPLFLGGTSSVNDAAGKLAAQVFAV